MTTQNDELFLKAGNIMQEVLEALNNGVKIPAECEKLILDCVDMRIDDSVLLGRHFDPIWLGYICGWKMEARNEKLAILFYWRKYQSFSVQITMVVSMLIQRFYGFPLPLKLSFDLDDSGKSFSNRHDQYILRIVFMYGPLLYYQQSMFLLRTLHRISSRYTLHHTHNFHRRLKWI